MSSLILLRGGGDLASGVALRLVRAGMRVLITEIPQPLAVRRLVSFSDAVYEGTRTVEGITAQLVEDIEQVQKVIESGEIPVIIDPAAEIIQDLQPLVLVDARMTKQPPDLAIDSAPLVIGLGPGFIASENCHAVVETQRGHFLGRVLWEGSAIPNTGIPGSISKFQVDRVLRAPIDGLLKVHTEICLHLEQGEIIAKVNGEEISAPFTGVLRGMLREGMQVLAGMKIGDLDPRDDPSYCTRISDKALAIGGGVLEAVLTQTDIRNKLWD
ncbi:MAG: EF2563 family selenium-dependent molybdenum hydroxylase system protein [Chloroflexi bacterium]|nr:EF2563 family selenium-dependent molybdenum hydroxylase system protein [Chloroflexota bacterium]